MFQRRSLMGSVFGSLVLATVFVAGVGSTMAFAQGRGPRADATASVNGARAQIQALALDAKQREPVHFAR